MAPRAAPRSWRIDLPPHEALDGLSERERLEIIERLNLHLWRHPAIRTMTVVVMFLSMGAGIFLNAPIAAWFQSLGMGRIVARMLGASLAALGVGAVALALGYWLLWSVWSRAFRSAMREIGRDVCVECGYWLRGLGDEVSRCPECGGARRVTGAVRE